MDKNTIIDETTPLSKNIHFFSMCKSALVKVLQRNRTNRRPVYGEKEIGYTELAYAVMETKKSQDLQS